VAISVPIIATGFAEQAWGLRTASVAFSVVVIVLALGGLFSLLMRPRESIS